MTTPEHTISALCKRSRDISLEKGWLNPDGTDPRPFYTVTDLFHSELSEAFEEVRNHRPLAEVYYEVKGEEGTLVELEGQPADPRRHFKKVMPSEEYKALVAECPPGIKITDAKPAGIPIELADFAIRVCQWAGSNGVGAELQEIFIGEKAVDRELPIEQLLAELHRYASLALEASWSDQDDPLEALAASLRDVFAFCKKNGIDLWAAIDEKEAYNRTRPIKHGGKAC